MAHKHSGKPILTETIYRHDRNPKEPSPNGCRITKRKVVGGRVYELHPTKGWRSYRNPAKENSHEQ